MRRLLVGIIVLLLLLVVAIAAFLFVPSPLQKWAVERGATLATGRQVTLGDPFRRRAWPPLSGTAADIRVGNAEWGKAAELARIDGLEASVDLLAFWRANRVVLSRLTLTRPTVNLEIAEDGRQNWALGDGAPKPRRQPRPDQAKPIPGFALGDVRIEGGAVFFDGRRATGRNRRAEAIDLAVAQAGADQPAKIDGGLTMAGKRATLVGQADRPQGMAGGENSLLVLNLSLPGWSIKYDGTVNTAAPAAKGRTSI